MKIAVLIFGVGSETDSRLKIRFGRHNGKFIRLAKRVLETRRWISFRIVEKILETRKRAILLNCQKKKNIFSAL